MSTVRWVQSSPHAAQSYSHQAVVAGKEGYDSSPLWVIRAYHSGDLIPGKLAINHKQAYIAFGGNEVIVHSFEVLCAPAHLIRWKPASMGAVPAGAIPGGKTQTGETLYIGRVDHMNSLTPGKVHPSHRRMYISFGGKEVPYTQYEVLCRI
ncbi:natterin-3-like isoform X2 [Hyposmocoma kahamanoa]|uniref:natterin-3-like isoform X2 n=1 Tax=Hyposmocoma kahamanoa TaxID=1477025 RepID=UPI000E6D9D65|nr:natterin-3-like isoform X2 [Hyposmocoma kahamanoa]